MFFPRFFLFQCKFIQFTDIDLKFSSSSSLSHLSCTRWHIDWNQSYTFDSDRWQCWRKFRNEKLLFSQRSFDATNSFRQRFLPNRWFSSEQTYYHVTSGWSSFNSNDIIDLICIFQDELGVSVCLNKKKRKERDCSIQIYIYKRVHLLSNNSKAPVHKIDEQILDESERFFHKYIIELYWIHCDNSFLITGIVEDRDRSNHLSYENPRKTVSFVGNEYWIAKSIDDCVDRLRGEYFDCRRIHHWPERVLNVFQQKYSNDDDESKQANSKTKTIRIDSIYMFTVQLIEMNASIHAWIELECMNVI